ncbi:MAG: hypothetical protein A2X94_15225 [Bdellovibrionales bacterium GWB1_55_8]|nr:MAG: hypothetical protein A2X94_15225 [Bdellovibrionales bacterium GWB1_55_8]
MQLASNYIIGTVAGLIATAPMTIFMELLYRKLPKSEKSPLPPRQLAMKVAELTGVKQSLSPDVRFATTLASHFSYGAAAGALYAAAVKHPEASGSRKGALFGAGVWLASYMGWIPALKLMTPASRHPARRSAIMISAHLIWGAATGLIMRQLSPSAVTSLR